MMENHVALAAERTRGGRSSTALPEWTLTLAADINNQFELGLNERELRCLAYVILRRANIAKAGAA